MREPSTIRVAAAQCHIGVDLDENLQTCLRMIRKAAECSPDLIVLPEFANHLSWYEDQAHCDSVSLPLDSPWLQAIADEAKAVGAYVVVNATVLREDGSCTGTSLMYSPEGELLGTNNKQVYIGHENDFLTPASEPGPIIETPLGRLAMYACMDGVINETPRSLGLRGAQVLCNSLNSFAPDEGNLHIPVRAAENRVFVVAANKVGPLIPDFLMAPVSEQTGIPEKFLCGAGDSQIVAPDGTVLAMAGSEEEVIWADIDPSQASSKINAVGTDIYASRRPDLYQAIGQDPATQIQTVPEASESLQAAMIQLSNTGPQAIEEALEQVREAVAAGAELVVLPELFFVNNSSAPDLVRATADSARVIAELSAVCGDAHVVLSVIEAEGEQHFHSTLVIAASGVAGRQQQLHASARLSWSALGDEVVTVDLPFGRLGLVTGADVIYPEMFRVIAMQGADVVAVPFAAQEAWELRTGLVERAAENRLNIVAVTQPSALGCSFANKLHKDFTVLTPWESREFDGNLTYPVMTKAGQEPGLTLAELTPANARDKVVSRGTHLIANRPWWLVDAITE